MKKAPIKSGNTIESSRKQTTVMHTSRRNKLKASKTSKSKYVPYKSLVGTIPLGDVTNNLKN
jgi:hypothetical protein